MSTTCLIGKENKDKTVTFIYCHHDGYIRRPGVGYILYNRYNEEDLDKLLKLGDLSYLGHQPISCRSSYDYAVYYCRPYSLRGERCPAKTVKNREEFQNYAVGYDYCYLFTEDGKWLVSTYNGEFVPIKDKL